MLVISRKTGESILIGDDIEVFVVETQRHWVRIGIRAPQSVEIVRRELDAKWAGRKNPGRDSKKKGHS